jgi:hypothetical protein
MSRRPTTQSLDIIRHMSGVELQDLAERGMELPDDCRQKLVAWQNEQAAKMRRLSYLSGELDRISPPGTPDDLIDVEVHIA